MCENSTNFVKKCERSINFKKQGGGIKILLKELLKDFPIFFNIYRDFHEIIKSKIMNIQKSDIGRSNIFVDSSLSPIFMGIGPLFSWDRPYHYETHCWTLLPLPIHATEQGRQMPEVNRQNIFDAHRILNRIMVQLHLT